MRSSRTRDKRPSNWLGRLITGLVIGLGVGAIALSILPAQSPAPVATSPITEAQAMDLTHPSSPAHAAPGSSLLRSGSGSEVASVANQVPTPTPTPRPIIRVAPPLDAPPALGNARGIVTGRRADAAPAARPAAFSVVLAIEGSGAIETLAQTIVGHLSQRGVNATLSPLADAGRPDVILALSGVSGPRNETWYCDPGPPQSTVLATELLDAVGPGPGDAPAAESPQSSFPCEDIHAGRARVPAVLLELASGGTGADASVVANALWAYLDSHRGAVHAARQAPRLTWPAIGPVTSHYDTSHPLGIDIGQSDGMILAATDGIVTFAGGDACCSYGIFVLIESGDGISTLYAHLDSLLVTEGQRVEQGQALGPVGCTGTCFGTHLHFEVWRDNVRQNPMEYLD